MTVAEGPVGLDAPDARQARLAAGVARLRTRSVAIDLERWLLIGGGVLLPFGVVLILLGWFGAAHTARSFEQTPYLISGGLLGVALVVAGGFLYFGYWLTRLVYEGRRQTQLIVGALERLQTLVADAAVGDGASAGVAGGAPRARGRGRAAAAAVPTFVATANGSMLHRPDCPVVAHKQGVRRVRADAKGFAPCRICDPLAAGDGAAR